MRLAQVPLWGLWGMVVIVISLPWIGFTTTPQWDRLHLRPFTDPQDTSRDLAANIALFVPFGVWFAAGDRSRLAFARAALSAAVVSVVAEAPQLFSTLRNPSATDVVAAMVGSTAGVALRRGVARLALSRQTP